MLRTWTPDGDNNAATPSNWTPGGLPQPGDTLQLGSGAMYVSGPILAGDPVTVPSGSTANITLGHNAPLNLTASFASADITVAGSAMITAAVSYGHLNITGGKIQFMGSSRIGGLETSNLTGTLTGTGTVTLTGGQGGGASVKVDGYVAPTLTFDLAAYQPALRLDIVHPDRFGADLDFAINGAGQAGFGSVLLEGVHATKADLFPGLLCLSNDHGVVAIQRVSGGTDSLTLQQTAGGVAISQNHYSIYPGTDIPLSHWAPLNQSS